MLCGEIDMSDQEQRNSDLSEENLRDLFGPRVEPEGATTASSDADQVDLTGDGTVDSPT